MILEYTLRSDRCRSPLKSYIIYFSIDEAHKSRASLFASQLDVLTTHKLSQACSFQFLQLPLHLASLAFWCQSCRGVLMDSMPDSMPVGTPELQRSVSFAFALLKMLGVLAGLQPLHRPELKATYCRQLAGAVCS